jgi:hypothetical protein
LKQIRKYVINLGPVWPSLFFTFYFSLNEVEKYKIIFDAISP